MSEMIERVARVLEPQAWAALGTGDTLAYKNRRTSSLRKARAAIEAMREPDPDGMYIGISAWNAKIDAALSEKPQDITVACKCGWRGRQSELNGNLCPKCSAPFKAWP